MADTRRGVIYGIAVLAAIAPHWVIPLTRRYSAVLWFVVLPLACITFLKATRSKVKFSWPLLVDDVRRSSKVLAGLFAYAAVVSLYLVQKNGPPDIDPRNLYGFVVSNIVEEIYFRATLIPVFELLERRLFDSVNRVRVITVTALAFGLAHAPLGRIASTPLIAARQALLTGLVGLFFGYIYYRSRNFPSVLIIHWWVNLQSGLLTLAMSRLLG